MPVIGTLSEFPLPEVIHLIGQRKGNLRLVDIPGLEPIELELFRGNLCFLQVGSRLLSDSQEIAKQLSAVIQATNGIFEFSENLGETPQGSLQLPIINLVMDVVRMVDEYKVLQR